MTGPGRRDQEYFTLTRGHYSWAIPMEEPGSASRLVLSALAFGGTNTAVVFEGNGMPVGRLVEFSSFGFFGNADICTDFLPGKGGLGIGGNLMIGMEWGSYEPIWNWKLNWPLPLPVQFGVYGFLNADISSTTNVALHVGASSPSPFYANGAVTWDRVTLNIGVSSMESIRPEAFTIGAGYRP